MMQFTIMSSRSLVRFEGLFRLFFKPIGFLILLAFLVFGHALAFSGWKLLLFSWDPGRVPAYSGLVYLIILISSVIFHELGHLIVALYKGDLSAGMHVRFNSWQPIFMVKRRKDEENAAANPVFNLAGILAQLLFASLLGILFFMTGYYALPASVVLIDLGALMSLILLPGSDGHRFLIDVLRYQSISAHASPENKKGIAARLISCDPVRHMSIYIMVIFVFFYIVVSSVLLIGISHQWSTGAVKGLTEGVSTISYAVQYAIIIAPGLMYLLSGLRGASLFFHSSRL